ncbi:hypothetical protein KAJ38_02030 [Candidatus Pacearchaeota archaeon]|nr:hypothetical protein [Candidatus Pacearchaeota archaeon]
MKKTIGIICLVVLLVIVTGIIVMYIPIPKEVIIPIRTEVEEAIKIKSADKVVETILHLGSLEDYLGSDTIKFTCKSAEQFVDWAPEGERIFTSLKLKDDRTLIKSYLSLTENQKGVFIYNDEHFHSEKGFSYSVKDYDGQKIVFRKNAEGYSFMLMSLGVMMILIAILTL